MEKIIELATSVGAAVPDWIAAIMLLMVGAKAIVALTPTPRDDEIVGKVYKVIEYLALNFGRAKDKPVNRE